MIFDHYNASYESLCTAFDLLVEMKRIRFIPHFHLVLGSVLETGRHSNEIHTRIAEKILSSDPLSVYLFSRESSILETQRAMERARDGRQAASRIPITCFSSSDPRQSPRGLPTTCLSATIISSTSKLHEW